jgi:conjugative transposon TraN protein
MKIHLKYILFCVLLLSFRHVAFPQTSDQSPHIELSFNKTSSIVFSAPITSVDKGSRDILVQKAKGVTNILQLKAGRVNFKETNLTVITADGMLHHFLVRYSEHPASLIVNSKLQSADDQNASVFFQEAMTDAALKQCADYILTLPSNTKVKSTSRYKMTLALQGLYIKDNIMFYHLRISNASNIPFHTDMLRFFVKDKQREKRMASQEVGELPLYVGSNNDVVPGNTAIDVVYALSKFTIPDAKVLTVELIEKRGGRHLELTIRNRTIMKATLIP